MLQDIPRQLHVIDTTLEAFSEHLRTHRGASPGTCDRNSREVRKLLERTCGDAPLDFSRLTPAALRAFLIERATTWSPRTGRRAATPGSARLGRAPAPYLLPGRPPTRGRPVFVRHFVPVGAALRSANVVGAGQRAFRRAKPDVPSRGPHTLGHTAAPEMVRAGV